MRERKRITIEDKEYVVRELTLREIINYFQELIGSAEESETKATDTLTYFKGEIQTLLNLALEGNYKVEDFLDFTPSVLKKLYDTFKEANQVFFDTAATMGLQRTLQAIKDSIQLEFSDLLVSSSKAAIQKSLTTGTPTS